MDDSKHNAETAGDQTDRKRLFEATYDELHAMARSRMRGERASHTLQSTALVHEAYLKLIADSRTALPTREQLLGLASLAMRRILIDRARSYRGPSEELQPESVVEQTSDAEDLLGLDGALTKLERVHPRPAKVVELCHFAGLTQEEAGAALGLSRDAVKLDWRLARAWLRRELGPEIEVP